MGLRMRLGLGAGGQERTSGRMDAATDVEVVLALEQEAGCSTLAHWGSF